MYCPADRNRNLPADNAFDSAASDLMRLVKRLLAGADADRGSVHVSAVPGCLVRAGCPSGNLVISEQVVLKCLKGKHSIPASIFERLPALLAAPAMIFDSASHPGAFVVITTASIGGKPVIAAIYPGQGARAEISRIASVYEKDFPQQILKWIDDGRLLSFDKKKCLAVMTESRLYIPTTVKLRQGGKTITVNFDACNHEIDAAAARTDPYPSAAAAATGRYAKGRTVIAGLPVVVENAQGSFREGSGRTGPWRQRMAAHYGYIAGTRGNDGDEVDCFIGPVPDAPMAYVVNQAFAGKFDEHKVCIGFPDEATARSAYLHSYAPGWRGLDSIVAITIPQLRAWLRGGDKARPLNAAAASQGQPAMIRTAWDSAANPIGTDLNAILYRLRFDDASVGALIEPMTVGELDAAFGPSEAVAFDGIVTTKIALDRKMAALMRVMEGGADPAVKPTGYVVSEPKLRKIVGPTATVNVDVLFTLADGQTITVAFHNPDTTPAKLLPGDTLISWRWLLNKRDVTILVSPERGTEVAVREVGRRIMKLAAKNAAAFAKATASKGERDAAIATLEQQSASLDIEIAKLDSDIADATATLADLKANPPTPAQEEPAAMPFVIVRVEGGKIDSAYPDKVAMKGAIDEIDSKSPGRYVGKDLNGSPRFIWSFAAKTAMLKMDARPDAELMRRYIDSAIRWANGDMGEYGSDVLADVVPQYISLMYGVNIDYAMNAMRVWVKGDAASPAAAGALPAGWTESSPGGMATNKDPEYGGIVDRVIGSDEWFVVFNNGRAGIDGLPNRAAAFAAFAEAMAAAPAAPVASGALPPAEAFPYAMVNRPAMVGGMPKVPYKVLPRPDASSPHYAMARHGIAVFERRLTDEETKNFELAPIIDSPEERTDMAVAVAEELREYATAYAKMYHEESNDRALSGQFASTVLRAFERVVTSYTPSIDRLGLVQSVGLMLVDIAESAAGPLNYKTIPMYSYRGRTDGRFTPTSQLTQSSVGPSYPTLAESDAAIVAYNATGDFPAPSDSEALSMPAARNEADDEIEWMNGVASRATDVEADLKGARDRIRAAEMTGGISMTAAASAARLALRDAAIRAAYKLLGESAP